MTVTLTTTKVVVTTPQVTKTVTTLTIERVVDNPKQEVVRAFVSELHEPIVLWNKTSTPTYSGIGQWTDEQVNARIIELFS